jgi:hypothetical protein
MALTTEQQASRLYKKLFGNAETLVSKEFFNEPYKGRSVVLPSQIWSDEDKIPNSAPVLSNGQEEGVIKYFDKLELSHIPGSLNQSYYNENLKDAIPFNFGDGSYNYKLFKNNGIDVINPGEGEWLVDTDAGVLTFYPRVDNPLPTGVNDIYPPRISFYKYIGLTGITIDNNLELPENYHENFNPQNSGTSINNVIINDKSFIFASGKTIDINTIEIHMNGTLYSYGITQGNSVFYTDGIPTSGCTLYFDCNYSNMKIELDDIIDLKFSTYGTDGKGNIITNEQGELNRFVSENRPYTISGNTNYSIPFTYIVGKNQLDIQINNNMLIYGIDWVEIGTGESNIIQFTYDIPIDWIIVVRKFSPVLNISGASESIVIEDKNSNIHTLVFENGILKTYNIS